MYQVEVEPIMPLIFSFHDDLDTNNIIYDKCSIFTEQLPFQYLL